MALIALFDILGFKNLARENSLAELKKRMGRDLDAQIEAMTRHLDERRLEKLRGKRFASLPAFWRELSRGAPRYCEHVRFSDTILLYVTEENRSGLLRLIIASQRLLVSSMFTGLPMRGALTRGDLYVSRDKRVYLGEGLVHAHELEVAQEWAGMIVDAQRLHPRPLTKHVRAELTATGLLVKYAVPRKEGAVRDELCIGWPFGVGYDLGTVAAAFRANAVPDWSAHRKIRATLDFYHYFQEKNKANELHVEAAKGDLKIKIRRHAGRRDVQLTE